MTKEPKLQSARRIIAEWPDLNREAEEFTAAVERVQVGIDSQLGMVVAWLLMLRCKCLVLAQNKMIGPVCSAASEPRRNCWRTGPPSMSSWHPWWRAAFGPALRAAATAIPPLAARRQHTTPLSCEAVSILVTWP